MGNCPSNGDKNDSDRNLQPTDSYYSIEDVMARTPEDHYAKQNPGAGWAGYKNPMYGGYLDHLSSPSASTLHLSSSVSNNEPSKKDKGKTKNLPSFYLESLPKIAALQQGKAVGYGDDIR